MAVAAAPRAFRVPPALAGLAALALVAAVMESLSRAGLVSPFTLPSPSSVLAATWKLVAEEQLLHSLGATLATTLAAIGCAVIVGVPAGYLLYKHRSFGLAYRNWLGALFAAPTVLLYPLVLVLFGRTYTAIAVMGFVTGIVPIILGTREGLASVPRTLINVGRACNVNPSQEFWKILLPAGALMIFTGIRLGTIYALLNVIGVEFLVNFGGLGFVVSNMYDRFDFAAMYGAIIFVILICVAILRLLTLVEDWLRPA